MADPSTGLRAGVRAFIALELPEEARAALIDARQPLEAVSERTVRWVGPDNLHLTLKFLGNTPEERLGAIGEAVQQAVRTVSPLALSLGGLGAFPSAERPRVFWAGLEGDLDGLSAVYMGIEEGLLKLGLPRENRLLSPHITLGRAREGSPSGVQRRIGAMLSDIELPALGFSAKEVVLFRSILRPGGPVYTPLSVGGIGHGL